ncbi:hypothetical protein ACFXTO_028003 [Malus domestica]
MKWRNGFWEIRVLDGFGAAIARWTKRRQRLSLFSSDFYSGRSPPAPTRFGLGKRRRQGPSRRASPSPRSNGGVEADKEGGLGGFVGLKEQERRTGCGEVWESGGFDEGVWRRKRELRVGLPETFIKGNHGWRRREHEAALKITEYQVLSGR